MDYYNWALGYLKLTTVQASYMYALLLYCDKQSRITNLQHNTFKELHTKSPKYDLFHLFEFVLSIFRSFKII